MGDNVLVTLSAGASGKVDQALEQPLRMRSTQPCPNHLIVGLVSDCERGQKGYMLQYMRRRLSRRTILKKHGSSTHQSPVVPGRRKSNAVLDGRGGGRWRLKDQ